MWADRSRVAINIADSTMHSRRRRRRRIKTRMRIRFRSARVNFKGRRERRPAFHRSPIDRWWQGDQFSGNDRSIDRRSARSLCEERKGRKILPHLNPIRQVKSGTGEDRCHGGQCRPQRAQHCHLIGRFESSSLSLLVVSPQLGSSPVYPRSPLFFSSLAHRERIRYPTLEAGILDVSSSSSSSSLIKLDSPKTNKPRKTNNTKNTNKRNFTFSFSFGYRAFTLSRIDATSRARLRVPTG